MKIRLLTHQYLTVIVSVAALGLATPSLRAQWGSIRGNNREAQEHREPQRGPAEVQHRQPEVAPRQPEVEHRQGQVEHRQGQVERGHVEAPRVYQEPRHEELVPERRQGYYWGNYHPGETVRVLPPGYVPLSVGGLGYYYYGGVYFRPTPAGPYAAVAPPLGAVVPELPPGAQVVYAGAASFYYAWGAFYLPQGNGFVVVPPPMGAVVNVLPPWATPVVIGGRMFYVAGSTYYMPVMAGGVTAYVVTQP
jgi:Family of unknown function (DUF6515)